MDLQFFRATKEDIDELVSLRIAYMIEEFGGITEEQRAGMEKQLPDYFERKLGTELIAFVASDGEKLIACALLHIIEMPGNAMLTSGLYGEVIGVYTKDDYRKQGICTHLMLDLVAYGKERGLGRIDLGASKSGYPVYQKIGFVEKEARFRAMSYFFEK